MFSKVHRFIVLALSAWVCLLMFSPQVLEAQTNPFLMDTDDSTEIVVNNRVLIKVNDKPITVMDVMKKMDMIFYREFPEYTSLKAARFQFYMGNWRPILQDLIDKELVLAEAEEVKLPVNNGEVRQEMEQLFGPNIIANLDKAGFSMEEACKMIQNDILIRRMLMFRVNSKAIRQVTHQDVRAAYDQYVKDHVLSDEWVYQFVSIRHPDEAVSSATAEKIYELLKEKEQTLDQISAWVEKNTDSEIKPTINVSNEFHHKEQEISPTFKEILLSLSPGSFSPPAAQKSRSDNTKVYRIFFLKEKVEDHIAPFQAMAAKLKDQLVQKAMDEETNRYINRLRQHFGIRQELLEKSIPPDFIPFSLQSARLR